MRRGPSVKISRCRASGYSMNDRGRPVCSSRSGSRSAAAQPTSCCSAARHTSPRGSTAPKRSFPHARASCPESQAWEGCPIATRPRSSSRISIARSVTHEKLYVLAMRPTRLSSERRLVLVVGAVMFVDTMFFAAIAPLLPSLAHELHLSKLSAGVMTAGYPFGTLVGSLPGGILAVRAGPKRTMIAGLALLGASTLAFGFLNSVAWLDAARILEGLGGACTWAGGLAWIVAEAPTERRGSLIGNALGAAIAGSLFGPVIGTAA